MVGSLGKKDRIPNPQKLHETLSSMSSPTARRCFYLVGGSTTPEFHSKAMPDFKGEILSSELIVRTFFLLY